MKIGFTVSIIAHIFILAILLISFSKPFPQDSMETEQISISLAPLGEELALRQGEKQPQKNTKPSPKPTEKPETRPDAVNIGDANIDTALPLNPKAKPREVKAPPPQQGEETAKAAPEPDKTQTAPEEQPKPAEEKPLAPEPAKTETVAEEKAPPVPAAPLPLPPLPPVAKPESAVKPTKSETPPPAVAEAPKDDIGDFLKNDAAIKPETVKPAAAPEKAKAEEKPVTPLPPKKIEEKPKKSAVPPPPAPQQKQEKSAAIKGEKNGAKDSDSQNALIDRTRTQGGGAKRSEGEAGQGARKTIGNQVDLQQTLNNIVGACVQRNWDIGVLQGGNAYDLRVQMHFKLKQDGSLDGEPELTPAGGDQKDRDVIAVQAHTALMKCTPFRLPADKYSQWHDVTINMKAFPD